MKGQMVNRNLMIALVVVVALGAVYFLFSGGFSSLFQPDIPQYTGQTSAPPAEPQAPQPAAPQPKPGTVGPSPISTPEGGEEGAPAPSSGATGAGLAPSPAAPVTKSPEEEKPKEEAKKPLTEEEKKGGLEAFKKIDSREIVRKRLEEAEKKLTKVDPEEGLPYPGVGRVDPLTYTRDWPEELRPPRSGETDWDKVLEYMMAAYGAAELKSIQIEVLSVMKIGLVDFVDFRVQSPYSGSRIYTMSVGASTFIGPVYLEVTSASKDLVTIFLGVPDENFNFIASETRSFIPGRVSQGRGGGGGGGGLGAGG